MRKNNPYYVRKIHRYLGLVIGIQFFMWTLGGFYFSWSNIDVIHGDELVNRKVDYALDSLLVTPGDISPHFSAEEEITSFSLTSVLDTPYYLVQTLQAGIPDPEYTLINARSGKRRNPISREEAILIAQRHFLPEAEILEVNYLDRNHIGRHHEYRESPLPAWAITFDHPSKSTLYIPVQTGQFQKIRTNKWRTFDFLWMFHTMDYQSRDHFGNVLLKAFSIFGMLTILSGFILFVISSPQRIR